MDVRARRGMASIGAVLLSTVLAACAPQTPCGARVEGELGGDSPCLDEGPAPEERVRVVRFEPDGSMLVEVNRIRLADGATLELDRSDRWVVREPDGREVPLPERLGPSHPLAVRTDGRAFAFAIGEDAILFSLGEIEAPRVLTGVASAARDVALSGDGGRLGIADALRSPSVWDVDAGERLFTLDNLSGGAGSIALSADGAIVALGGPRRAELLALGVDGTVERLSAWRQTSPVWKLAISPTGDRLAVFMGRHTQIMNGDPDTEVSSAPRVAIWSLEPRR